MDFRSYIKNLLIEDAEIQEDFAEKLTQPEPLKLFQDAFTHISYDPENNYEVLEFIGDGYVKAINSEYIPERFGEELKNFTSKSGTGEGVLSKTRRVFEQRKLQEKVANRLNMWDYVRKGPEYNNDKIKLSEDVLEAFIGALTQNVNKYIYDGFGYMFAKKFLTKQLDIIPIDLNPETLDDPITRLNELYKANELKNHAPLKWGDAKYIYTQLMLPNVDKLPPASRYRPGEMIFNVDDGKAYYSNGKTWTHPANIPLGTIPKVPRTGLDPRKEENKHMFTSMSWTQAMGKDPQGNYKRPDNEVITRALENTKSKINESTNLQNISRELQNTIKTINTMVGGMNVVLGQGSAFTQKQAKMIAARNALKLLKEKYNIEK